MERNTVRDGGPREAASREERPDAAAARSIEERAAVDVRPAFFDKATRRRSGAVPSTTPDRPMFGSGVGQVERRGSGITSSRWHVGAGPGWSRAGDVAPPTSGTELPREPEGREDRRAPTSEPRPWAEEGAPVWSGASRRRQRWTREPVTAGEIMTVGIRTVQLGATLREVAHIMRDEACGIVPVVTDDRRLLGIVRDRDIVIRGHAEGGRVSDLLTEHVMSNDVECVTTEDDIGTVVELMGKHQMRRIPVVDRQDRLLGVVSMTELASRADYDTELQEALERISARRSFWSRAWS